MLFFVRSVTNVLASLRLRRPILVLFLLLQIGNGGRRTPGGVLAFTDVTIHVQFYGESQCPFCRQFVRLWHDVWQDFTPYVNYEYVPWGNGYFATTVCGAGPYSLTERECWYDHCIVSSPDDEEACFGGPAVYQHSDKEGIVDVYETCVADLFGIDAALDFTYCCEGDNMDDDSMNATQLMALCLDRPVEVEVIQHCYDTRAHYLEVRNAKQTPPHPGVPYVVVDGTPLDDPLDIVRVICDKLQEAGEYPSICTTMTTTTAAATTTTPAAHGLRPAVVVLSPSLAHGAELS
jgi:Gamma interferon inducible lysosomal thiol reductase (GILT)